MSNTLLFGGAVTCDLLDSLSDVSKFRDVPDHQEFFINDQLSVIIEINQASESGTGNLGEYYLRDYIEVSEGSHPEILVSDDSHGVGSFLAKRQNSKVYVALGIKRIPEYHADMNVIVNGPDVDTVKDIMRRAINSLTVLDYKLFK
jgi:Ran-interacting Mog1 protein